MQKTNTISVFKPGIEPDTMYSAPALARKYIQYYLTASNGKGHGIHSPFVYDFVTNVLNDKRHYYAYTQVEQLREALKSDQEALEIVDMGAGSVSGNTTRRTVASIVRNAAKSRKLAQLLFRVANHYGTDRMLELGTSLGITTSYLSLARLGGTVTTIEGAPAIAAAAARSFQSLGLRNVAQLTGNFDEVLPALLPPQEAYDFVYIDGNHRKAPTLRYFQQLLPNMSGHSVMIFDDIHWSREMEEAWEEIKQHPAVMMSIDLFFLGFVFFRPEFLVKQHFTIRF